MTINDIDKIAEYLESPDVTCVSLGYGLIASDADIDKVAYLYGAETNALPANFKDFSQVCKFVKQKSEENTFMKQSWPLLADTLYRPAAYAVLSRIRRLKQ